MLSKQLLRLALVQYLVEYKSISEIANSLNCPEEYIISDFRVYGVKGRHRGLITAQEIDGYINSNYSIKINKSLNWYINKVNSTILYRMLGIPLEILGIMLLVITLIPIAILDSF